MQDTRFETFQIATSAANLPTTIAKAPKSVPVRVLVRNIGALLIFLGKSVQDVAGPDGPTTSTYRLNPDNADVFVLAPNQTLYAVCLGLGGIASVSISDAMPFDMRS